MTYSYWKLGRHNEYAVFDVFFRQCPFGGEYEFLEIVIIRFTVFGGLENAIDLIKNFKFTKEHIEYLKYLLEIVNNDIESKCLHVNLNSLNILLPLML